MIVINPVVETGLVNFRVPSSPWSLLFGTKIASLYVQPHIGGDLALLAGIAKRIDEMGAQDEAFLRTHTNGYEPWLAHLAGFAVERNPRKIGRLAGPDRPDRRALCRRQEGRL